MIILERNDAKMVRWMCNIRPKNRTKSRRNSGLD